MAQAALLRKRGYTVWILTPRPRKHLTDAARGVIFVGNSANVRTPIKTSLELGVSLSRDEVDDILAREQFDLLHVHEPEVPVVSSQIITKAQCPIVATFHAIHPETPMARTIETFRIPYSRSIFSKLSAMTAVSDAAAGFVQERTKQPVRIIPNGIDLRKYLFRDDRPKRNRRSIVYIGRLEKRKGVLWLLKAYEQLQISLHDIELIVAGDGELRKNLEDYATAHKLRNVEFLGYVTEKRKLELLHRADLFCSPALYGESFGIVLLEAMACGSVIVAGANPGYSGVLRGTGSISLVDPRHTDEMCRRMQLLLEDHKIRNVWTAWAKKYVTQFDYEKIIGQYETLYREVLGKQA